MVTGAAIILCLVVWPGPTPLHAQATDEPRLKALAQMRVLTERAQLLYRQGKTNEALTTATQAIRLAPDVTEGWLLRGRLQGASGAFGEAAADFARVLTLQPDHAEARFQRAVARFRQGRLAKSLEDFDRLAQQAPARAPELWQRGVALSLAGRHADARQQFEAYHRAHTNDVEAAAWHFLSVARLAGFEAARTNLLAVGGDPRMPMTELWQLYAGRGPASAVDAAVDGMKNDEEQKATARFYARLYVAMYLDAAGKLTDAQAAAADAARLSAPFDLLGQAARLYADQLRDRAAANGPAAPTAGPSPP